MQEELEELAVDIASLLQQYCLNLILILVDELVAVYCCDTLEVSAEAVEALILEDSSQDKLSESTCKLE